GGVELNVMGPGGVVGLVVGSVGPVVGSVGPVVGSVGPVFGSVGCEDGAMEPGLGCGDGPFEPGGCAGEATVGGGAAGGAVDAPGVTGTPRLFVVCGLLWGERWCTFVPPVGSTDATGARFTGEPTSTVSWLLLR